MKLGRYEDKKKKGKSKGTKWKIGLGLDAGTKPIKTFTLRAKSRSKRIIQCEP